MKLLSILMGVLFVFSVSQKTFATDAATKTEKTATTAVADAKDATKTDAAAEKTCACEKAGKECGCKGGKECSCGKHKDKNHKHDKAHKKHGKDCGCDDKHEA